MSDQSTLICLIGEQPIPNLLPIRHLRPHCVVLVHTPRTAPVAQNVASLLPPDCLCHHLQVDAVDISLAIRQLYQAITSLALTEPITVNLTGGTKPMSLAAYTVARERRATVVYLETRPGVASLSRFGWDGDAIVLMATETLRGPLSIHEYLAAHGQGGYRVDHINQPFERAVTDALRQLTDEILANVRIEQLEMDAVLRRGTSFAVAEIKSGNEARKKAGIDQLNTATQREFLGMYTGRLLILDQRMPSHNRQLAIAHGVQVVELTDAWQNGLSDADVDRLSSALDKVLGQRQ